MPTGEDPAQEKLYLDVPFPEKDHAKALGARWDRDARSWYVPSDLDVEPFARWLTLLPSDGDPVLPIAGLPQRCWKCGEDTMAVIACEDEGLAVPAHPLLAGAVVLRAEGTLGFETVPT